MKKLIACVMIITMMCTTAVLGDEMTGVENKANVENETTVTPDDGLGLGSGIDLYYDNFSTFDVYEIPYKELDKYFVEFKNGIENCRYIGCSHIKEDECGVKDLIEENKIDRQRYENYIKIYEELKDKEEHKW